MPQTHVQSTTLATSKRFAPETPILVFFWSRTCGHSRRMDSLVDHFVRSHRGNVRLAKVEISDRPDLAERLAVSEAPTVLLLHRGTVLERLEGRNSLPAIKDLIEPHIDPAAHPHPLSLALA